MVKGIHMDTHPKAGDRIYMIESFLGLIGFHEESYIEQLALELVGDAAVKLLGKQISIPMLDRELNLQLEETLNNLNIDYKRPRWITDFQ